MGLFIQVNGWMEWKMDMDNKSGLMGRSMMASGRMIRLTVMENLYTQMVTSTMDNGKMTRHMEWVITNMQTVQPIMESGKMINNMGMVQRLGQMEPGMRGATLRARNMGRELYALQTEAFTQVTFNTTRYQEEENTCGLMASPMKGSGKRTRCMDTAYWHGKTARGMKDILSMIRERVKESSIGKMEEYMMDNGKMENSMEEECSQLKMEYKEWENGTEAGRQSGLPDHYSEFIYTSI
jgi:hypothetical protein